MEYRFDTSDIGKYKSKLCAGDRVLLSGRVYTARDAAHKRIITALDSGEKLPFELMGAVIYYAGPTPAPEGFAVGSCGPTTSARMDEFTPRILDLGVAAMIGKGERNLAVMESIVKNEAVYFCAIGGAGALASKCIKSCSVLAYEDLGCESVKELIFADFPLVVAADSKGGNIFTRS